MKTIFFLLFFATTAAFAQQNSLFFKGSYDDLIRLEKNQKKLIVLDFGAKWCIHCEKLVDESNSNKFFNDFTKTDFIFYHIDIETTDGQLLSKRFKVNEIPTVIVLDRKNRVLKHIIDPYPITYLSKELRSIKY